MAGEISVSGLAGGFDYSKILEKIQTLKSQQLYLAQAKQSQIEAKKSVVKDIQSILNSMKDTVNKLADPSLINSKQAKSSDENILTVSISDPTKASIGAYQISVDKLARNEVYSSSTSISNKDIGISDIGTGTLTIKQKGLSFIIAYDPSHSLQYIANHINTVAQTYNGDFRASVVNVGTSTSPDYRLVISSTKTGVNSSFTISDTGNLSSYLGLNKIREAQDAEITINDLKVRSSTNQFSNVVEGLIFTAKRVGDVDVTVEDDPSPLKQALTSIVNQYNNLVNKINAETGKGGKLSGEYGLNQIKSAIYRQLEDLINSDIIKFDRNTGTLSFNSSKFEEIYNNTSNTSLSGLVENREELLSTISQIKTNLSQYLTQTTVTGGTVDSMIKSYDRQIASLKESMERMSSRVQLEIEVLKRQFIYMESIQAQYNAIGIRIQQTFGLNNSNR